MALRPINRIKHVVDAQGGSVAGTQTVTTVAIAVETPALATANEVSFGSKINGIYLKVEVTATSGTALSNCYLAVFKNPGDNLTLPAANAIGVSDNKRFSIHQEMVMLQKEDAVAPNPRILFNGVIAIPKGYRRFTTGDTLQVAVLSIGANVDFCLQCHYKEFR